MNMEVGRMEQKREAFQELIKADGMSEENIVEVNSVGKLTELLQQTAEDGTVVSVTVEVDAHE